MATFQDNKGRTWDLTLNIATLKRVRERVKVDLLSSKLPHLLEQVFTDPVALCDVLFAVVEPIAKKDGVTDVAFGESLAGDCIDAAGVALLESIRDFTPNPRTRARVGEVVRGLLQAAEAMNDAEDARLKRAMTNLQTAVAGGSSTSSPALPASAQTPSP